MGKEAAGKPGVNKYRGEVEFQALGQTFTLRLGFNELLVLQEELGLSEENMLQELSVRMSQLNSIRKIFQRCVAFRHEDFTAEQAGDVITEVGVQQVAGILQQALRWAMPEAEKEKAGDRKRPNAAAPSGAGASS